MASALDVAAAARSIAGNAKARILEAVGGSDRLQIIAVLAAVLGLDAADKGAISAVSDQLKQAFAIDNTEIGLLIAVVSFIGAIAALPMGVLADRMRRRTILLCVISLWAAAMVLSGTATSYLYLLVTRIFLGAVTAAAWPSIASLTGDFFPARERAGIFGLILCGELIGAGIGFFISGEASSFGGWHWSFYAMAAPSLAVLWAMWRWLPEPERGRQSWISAETRDSRGAGSQAGSAGQKVLEANVEPREQLVLHEDPTRRSLWWVACYLLRLPTYRLLIGASTLAYFFFSGVRAFTMIYLTEHYGLSRAAVSGLVFVFGAGALAGFITGGRLAERLLSEGKFSARIVVPAVALFASVPFLAVGIWTKSVWLGIGLLTVGAGALASAMAPIDAARLDIVHPRLWGRGEAGRMVLRSAFEGGAPLLFGAVSVWLGGGAGGLMRTFLLMLIPMLGAGLLVLPGRRSYPRDVATAAASLKATAEEEA